MIIQIKPLKRKHNYPKKRKLANRTRESYLPNTPEAKQRQLDNLRDKVRVGFYTLANIRADTRDDIHIMPFKRLKIVSGTRAKYYVYLIHVANSSQYKIGVTTNLIDRMRTLQGYSPIPLYCLGYCPIRNKSCAYKIEKALHLKYSRCKLHGEWFDLSIFDVEKILARKHFVKVEGLQFSHICQQEYYEPDIDILVNAAQMALARA